MENYELIKQVGEGSFGQVFKARRKCDGATVAFKVTRTVSFIDRLIVFLWVCNEEERCLFYVERKAVEGAEESAPGMRDPEGHAASEHHTDAGFVRDRDRGNIFELFGCALYIYSFRICN